MINFITIARKKLYYQQIFDFNYCLAKFVDGVYLNDLPINIQQSELLISKYLCHTHNIMTNCLTTPSISLFLASTSLNNLHQVFTDILILLIAENKQLFLNGESYRVLSQDNKLLTKLLSTTRRYGININMPSELFKLPNWQELSVKYLTTRYFNLNELAISQRFKLRLPLIKNPDLIVATFNQLLDNDLTLMVENTFKKRFQSIYKLMEEL